VPIAVRSIIRAKPAIVNGGYPLADEDEGHEFGEQLTPLCGGKRGDGLTLGFDAQQARSSKRFAQRSR